MHSFIARAGLLHLLLSTSVIAGDQGSSDWNTWPTTTAAPPAKETIQPQQWSAVPETDTVYITTTTTVYKEVTTTVTNYETKTVPTTVYITSVSQASPTTVTVTKTEVSVSGSIQTLFNTVVNTATVSDTVYNTATVQNTVFNTATVNQPVTVTGVVTNVVTQTLTISTCPVSTTEVLTTLKPCTSRIVNAEYTGVPASQLPSNFTWGCPPGKLCRPKQVDCNFERNPPARSWLCNPEDCYPVEPLPPLDYYLGLETKANPTCAFISPVDHYFNLEPSLFGLDFNIFQTLGQAECTTPPPVPPPSTPPPPPPPTTTPSAVWTPVPVTYTTPSAPPPPPPTTSSWKQWTTSVAPPPEPQKSSWSAWSQPENPSPVQQSWDGWSQSSHAQEPSYAPEPANTWAGWTGSGNGPHTKRAVNELIPRQSQAIIAPFQCYSIADVCTQQFQKIGKSAALCESGSDFLQSVANLRTCAAKYSSVSNDPPTLIDSVNTGLTYCNLLNSGQSSSSASVAPDLSTSTSSSSSVPPSSASSASSASSSATERSSSSTTAAAQPTSTSATGASTSAGGTSSVTTSSGGGGSTSTGTRSSTTSGTATASPPVSSFDGSGVMNAPPAIANSLLSLLISLLAFI